MLFATASDYDVLYINKKQEDRLMLVESQLAEVLANQVYFSNSVSRQVSASPADPQHHFRPRSVSRPHDM